MSRRRFLALGGMLGGTLAMAGCSGIVQSATAGTVTRDSAQEITNLEHRFIEALDQVDVPAVAGMFTHGALEIVIPGRPEPLAGRGEAEVTQVMNAMFPPRPPGSFGRHIASNLIIEVDEAAGTATARMYTALYTVAEGKPSHFRGLGRHTDEFGHIDGRWWFTRKYIKGDVVYAAP